MAQASIGTQRAAGDSKRGLDHMFQPGLGKEEHVRRAREAANPFDGPAVADPDLVFAATVIATFGPQAKHWREMQFRAFRSMSRAMQPLSRVIQKERPLSVAKVAGGRDAATMAGCTALLRWPDRRQPEGYVRGFPIIGDISSSQVFRQLQGGEDSEIEVNFFGQPAVRAVQEAEAAPPPKDAEAILA